MARWDGVEPCSYLLDPTVNWLPEAAEHAVAAQRGRYGLCFTCERAGGRGRSSSCSTAAARLTCAAAVGSSACRRARDCRTRRSRSRGRRAPAGAATVAERVAARPRPRTERRAAPDRGCAWRTTGFARRDPHRPLDPAGKRCTVRTIVAPLAPEVRAELDALDRRRAEIARRYIRRLRLQPFLGAPIDADRLPPRWPARLLRRRRRPRRPVRQPARAASARRPGPRSGPEWRIVYVARAAPRTEALLIVVLAVGQAHPPGPQPTVYELAAQRLERRTR